MSFVVANVTETVKCYAILSNAPRATPRFGPDLPSADATEAA